MIRYIKIGISIHGVEIANEDVLGFLTGWLREATKAALLGNQAGEFKFRDDFDDDIEVEIEEYAGVPLDVTRRGE